VKSVLFVTSLSEFDCVLVEDSSVNRMKESLRLFYETCKLFYQIPIMLFLNKSDILTQLLDEGRSIKSCFEDYQGSNDFDESTEYIKDQFINLVSNVYSGSIYTHITCATDTKNIEFVFDSVQHILLGKIMGKMGLEI